MHHYLIFFLLICLVLLAVALVLLSHWCCLFHTFTHYSVEIHERSPCHMKKVTPPYIVSSPPGAGRWFSVPCCYRKAIGLQSWLVPRPQQCQGTDHLGKIPSTQEDQSRMSTRSYIPDTKTFTYRCTQLILHTQITCRCTTYTRTNMYTHTYLQSQSVKSNACMRMYNLLHFLCMQYIDFIFMVIIVYLAMDSCIHV